MSDSSPPGDSRPLVAAAGAREWTDAAVDELKNLDQAVYSAIADTPTPTLDEPLRRLSDAGSGWQPAWVWWGALEEGRLLRPGWLRSASLRSSSTRV
jgi:hypothetical protein